MVTTALLGFAAASTLLILAPGPDSMLVMRNTMRAGRKAGYITACGTMSGLTIWALAAALGLSALLRVSQVGYDVLRFAGAGYLIWLGATSLGLRRRRTAESTEPTATPGRPGADGRAYLNGLLSNLFNPKISVFFMAFLPAFIPAGVSTATFSLVLRWPFGFPRWSSVPASSTPHARHLPQRRADNDGHVPKRPIRRNAGIRWPAGGRSR